MKKALIVSLVVLSSAFLSVQSHAQSFFIFKAAAAIPVQYVVPGTVTTPDKVLTKTLTGKELINLTQGLPIDTPVDATQEILAVAVGYEEATNPPYGNGTPGTPTTKLIIWKPGALNAAGILKTIAPLTTLDLDRALAVSGAGKGQGIATISIPEGTGDNKLFAATLTAGAHGTTASAAGTADITTQTLTVNSAVGRVKFQFTYKNPDPSNPGPFLVSGIVTKGTLRLAGKFLASF